MRRAPRTGGAEGEPGGRGAAGIASLFFRVTSLAWPERALGLAATDAMVVWEQRDPSPAVSGPWS